MLNKVIKSELLKVIAGSVIVAIAAYLVYVKFISAWKNPLPGGRLTSPFGNRKHPVTGVNTFHNGIDIAAPIGTKIYAPNKGTIKETYYHSTGGNTITIEHAGGYTTGFAHLHEFKAKPGQKVKKGEVIGTVGSSGVSTGPHLHFTVRLNKELINPLNLIKI
jgi:murein DD-endopeptidase MepM/ murein hydrolase activator NlpD